MFDHLTVLRGPVNSYLVWSIGYAMFLGAAIVGAVCVAWPLAFLAVLFLWRALWNLRRLALWIAAARALVGQL